MRSHARRWAAGVAAASILATVGLVGSSGAQSPGSGQQNANQNQAKKVQPVVRQAPPRQASRPQQADRQPVQRVVKSPPTSVPKVPQSGSGQVVKKSTPVTPPPKVVTVPDVKKSVPKVDQKAPPLKTTTPATPQTSPGKVSTPGTGIVTPKLPPPGGGTVPGKLTAPVPGSGVVPPDKLTTPGGPLKGPIPGSGVVPGKLTTPVSPIVPVPGANKLTLPNKLPPPVWKGSLAQPAAGLSKLPGLAKITPFKPVKPGLNLSLLPKLPPVPPKKWGGLPFGAVPPKLAWHPWKGRNYFPYFFVGAVTAVVVAGSAYSYWSPPPPSCYAGGSTVYYYPGTRRCFDFAVAEPDDPFECHGRVFRWQPTRYRTVETLIAETADTSEPAEGWVEKEPARKVVVEAGLKRATARAQSVATVPLEQLDCSACLAALGPTVGEDGQATVSLVNNCEHDVTVAGGLTKVDVPAGTAPVCEFVGDVPAGGEVAACTKPADDFTDAQLFMNTVVPVAGTTNAAPACRVPEQRAEAPAPKAQ